MARRPTRCGYDLANADAGVLALLARLQAEDAELLAGLAAAVEADAEALALLARLCAEDVVSIGKLGDSPEIPG